MASSQVGAPGVGKTSLLSSLSKAIARICKKPGEPLPSETTELGDLRAESSCAMLRVNPKALEESALFGRMDPNTKEWVDGIVSAVGATRLQGIDCPNNCIPSVA